MPTQSASIMVLLAGALCRHENPYEPGQVLRTGRAAIAVVLRSRRMIEPAGERSLVAPACLPLLSPPRESPADARAALLAMFQPVET
jgi:hypothetical protein